MDDATALLGRPTRREPARTRDHAMWPALILGPAASAACAAAGVNAWIAVAVAAGVAVLYVATVVGADLNRDRRRSRFDADMDALGELTKNPELRAAAIAAIALADTWRTPDDNVSRHTHRLRRLERHVIDTVDRHQTTWAELTAALTAAGSDIATAVARYRSRSTWSGTTADQDRRVLDVAAAVTAADVEQATVAAVIDAAPGALTGDELASAIIAAGAALRAHPERLETFTVLGADWDGTIDELLDTVHTVHTQSVA